MGQASAIRVLEQSPDRLLLYEPPYWPFGIAFVLAGVLIASLLFLFFWKLQLPVAVRFLGCVLALPFLFFGLKALTSQTFFELSGRDRTFKIQHTRFFQSDSPQVIPLDEILRAVELHARRSYAVGLLLRSGKTVALTSYGDQPGKPLMMEAINGFIGRTR